MSRYADVNALMQSIKHRLGIASLDNLLESEKAIVKEIGSAPSIDIVHCGECKYWHSNTQFCAKWSHGGFISQRTLPNDFCSCGERKDDE